MDSNYVNDPNVGNRLVVLLTNNSLSQKDREFVTSLQTTWNRFSQLTKRQYDYFEVVEKRYDPAIVAQVQQERQRWFDAWDDDKKLRFNLCCEYYSVTPYFRDIAAKGLVDNTFIPTEKQYRAMCENNYAKRLYENMTTRNFDDGEVIQYRGKNTYRGDLVGTVITALDKITSQSANIGGRQYRVMWMTTGEEEIVLEKNIKKYRGK